jgi:2-iminoacetate synthase
MSTTTEDPKQAIGTRKASTLAPAIPNPSDIIDEPRLNALLEESTPPDENEFRELMEVAREMKGLTLEQVSRLLMVEDREMVTEMGHAAKWIKEEIYGRRLVFFAPMYLTNKCNNNCLYCAFRRDNKDLERHTLTMDELRHEVLSCEAVGQKRLLLVMGESGTTEQITDYIIEAVKTVYDVKKDQGEIRRVNVNVPALEIDQFKRVKEVGIGTYQLFQETYRRSTFATAHPSGPKSNYDYHLNAMDRAQLAGIDDNGIGVLFGLDDYRFEIMAMMQHANHLESTYGTGPHTISVPRMNPAEGAEWADNPPYVVTDDDFKKLVAIIRMAVPYTGMILTTRETPELRREVVALGISQLSAGSRTQPGGYGESEKELAQFSLGDHRPLDEVIREVIQLGYVPSFCTACYRRGRTGADFMDLAKPGLIKSYCLPNALSTFAEYLSDYASEATREIGWPALEKHLTGIEQDSIRNNSQNLVIQVKSGQRDVQI